MTADLDLSPEAVERLARPVPVSNNLQVTPAITHGYALELRPVRWLPYKPDGQRQMKQRGRWQEMNEYGGWGNCKTPNEIWPGLTAPDLISDYHAALAENARLRAERDEQRERAEDAESEITRAQEQVSAEFEGDCWKAMRNLLDRTGFDWSEYSDDGVTADDAHQWIVEELDRLEAERDAARQAGAEAMQKVAARTAVATPATRSDKAGVVWHDGFTSGCLHAADAIRALPLPDQPKEGA